MKYIYTPLACAVLLFCCKPALEKPAPDGLLNAIVFYNGDPHLPHPGVIDCEDIAVSEGIHAKLYHYMIMGN